MKHEVLDEEVQNSSEGRVVRFTPDISAGAVLQAIVVATCVIVYVVTVSNKATDAEKSIVDLRTEMSNRFTDLRQTVAQGQAALQQQISGLPDQRAMIDQYGRRLDHIEAFDTTADQRMSANEAAVIRLRSDLDNLIRASGVPLPADGKAQRR